MSDEGYYFGTGPSAPIPMAAEPSELDRMIAAQIEAAKAAPGPRSYATFNKTRKGLGLEEVGDPDVSPEGEALIRDLAQAGRDAAWRQGMPVHAPTAGERSLMPPAPAPLPDVVSGAGEAPGRPPLGGDLINGRSFGGAYTPEADWGVPSSGMQQAQDAMVRDAMEARRLRRYGQIDAEEQSRGSAIDRAIMAQKAQQEYDMGLPAGTEPSIGWDAPGADGVLGGRTMPGLAKPGQPTIGDSARTAPGRRDQERALEVLRALQQAQNEIEGSKAPSIEKDARRQAAERRALIALQAILGKGFERFFPAERADPNLDIPAGPPTAGGGR